MALNYSYNEVLEVISTLRNLRDVVDAASVYNDQVIGEFTDFNIDEYLKNTFGKSLVI